MFLAGENSSFCETLLDANMGDKYIFSEHDREALKQGLNLLHKIVDA